MTLRSREQSLLIGCVCAAATIYWLVIAIRGLVWHDDIAEAVFGIAGGVIFATVLFRAARACVVVDGTCLKVVNTFRTTSISADEILEIRLGPKRPTLFYGAAALELRSGRELIAFGIQSHNPMLRGEDDSAQKLVSRLNEWLMDTRKQSTADKRTDRHGRAI